MEQNQRNGVSRYFMFFDKGRVYETMSRTGIEKTRDIGDIKRQKRNGRAKGKKIRESARIEMQLCQSTVRLNATPRLCVMEVAVYFFASKEAEPDVETAGIAITARPFADLEVDFRHSFAE